MIEFDINEDEANLEALGQSPDSAGNGGDTSFQRETPNLANTTTQVDDTRRLENQCDLLADVQQPSGSTEESFQTRFQMSPLATTYDAVPTSLQSSPPIPLLPVGPQDGRSVAIPIPSRAEGQDFPPPTQPVAFLAGTNSSLPAIVQEVLPKETHELIEAISEAISMKMTSSLVNAANTLNLMITSDPDGNNEQFKNGEDMLNEALVNALGGPKLYTLGMRKIIKVDISRFSNKSVPKFSITPIPARLIQNLQGDLIREPTPAFTNLFVSTVIAMTETAIKAAGLEVEDTWDCEKSLHIKRHEEQNARVAQGACLFWIAEEDFEWTVSEGKTREMGGGEGDGVTFEWKCGVCHGLHTVQVYQ